MNSACSPTLFRRFRAGVTSSLVATIVTVAACATGSTDVQRTPWEGTWRLVRIDAQPVPYRIGDVEVRQEDVRFIFGATGFVSDRKRTYAATGGTTGSDSLCESWFQYQVVGSTISTAPSPTQPAGAGCPDGVAVRTFTLEGDTLRTNGGPGFTLGARPRAYVRVGD